MNKTVLLVEDSSDDELLFKIVCRRAGIVNPVLCVHDGAEAIAYLTGEGAFSDRAKFPLPGIIVLDLKMPRCDGFEVLRWLRSQRDFASVPVLVLTGSLLEADKVKAEELGARWYFQKPCEVATLNGLAHQYPAIWMRREEEPTETA